MSTGLFTLNLHSGRSVCDTATSDTLTPENGSSSVIAITRKSIDAYYRVLGGIDPRENLYRLIAFNKKAFAPHFRAHILKVLEEKDPLYYYKDPQDVIEAFEPLLRGGNFGNLERHWKSSTDKPNPHHLVPSSRWGTWNLANIQGTCRYMHDDFHALFVNLTPVEQLRHICHMLSGAFTAEFLADFMQATAPDVHYPIYTPRAIDPIAASQWIVGTKKVIQALITQANSIQWGYAPKRSNKPNPRSNRARQHDHN